jgi:hypothetical protein
VVVLNDLYVDVAGDTMTGQLNAPRYGVGATPPTTGAIRLTADTLAAGGIYFGSDTNLYRTGPGALRTDGSFMAAIGLVGRNNSSSTNPLAATPALTLRNTNTSNNSLTEISFEDGNGTSVGVLTYRVPDHSTHYGDFRVYTRSPSGMKVRFAVPQTGGFQVYSDASSALTLSATDMGVLQFAADVNLYRSAADTLKTDDTFEALELRTATYRTVSLTRTLPTTIGNMVMIGSFALNNGAAVFDIAVTVQDSSFSVAKRYLFTVQNAITGAAYYQVLPISDTRAHTSNDFALDVNTTGATAYLRLRRLSGGYAGTANISIRHSGKADVFTPDSSSGTSGPAVTTYYPNAIATQAAGNLLIGTPDLPVINTTTAAQFGLDADDRVLTLNGAATGAALNIESTLPMVAGSVGKRFGSIVFTATAGQADVHRQVSGIVSRATALTGNYALQADLGFYVKADTAPVEVLTLTPTATTSSVLVQAPSFRQGPTGPTWTAGTGTPEGAVTAPVGSIFSRSDGGTDTTFYRKESGSGNTGWVATAAGGAGGVTSVDGQTGVVNLSGNYVDVAGDTMTGSLGLGVAPTAKLHFAADTTATGGIGFGADTNLYRVAADTLKTDDSLQVGLVESVIIGSAGRMSIAAGPTVFSDCMLRVGYPGVQNQFASASLVTGLSVQPVNSANGDMRGIEAQPVHSGTGGTVATMIGVTTRVRFANATGTLSSSNALLIDSPLITSGGKINNAYGIMINGQNTAGTQDAVGIYMRAQSPTANGYGILLEAAKTNTLWLSCNANNTTESAGIVFGSSRDTNLYRSAADTLKTDDKMTALAFVTGSAPAVVGAIRMSATDLIAWRNDTNTLDTASITVDGIRELTLESANGGKFTVGGTAICGWYPNAFALADGVGLTVGTTAGSKIGTATTQKLGFWNATPVVQNTGWSVTAGYTALKALDPQTATLAQVARALGTLLDQLKTYGLLG